MQDSGKGMFSETQIISANKRKSEKGTYQEITNVC
jgi:hypothetical protein